MLMVGLLVFFVLPLMVVRLLNVSPARLFVGDWPVRAATAVIAVAFVAQLFSGFDWLRWTATWSCLLLTVGLALLDPARLWRPGCWLAGVVRMGQQGCCGCVDRCDGRRAACSGGGQE